MGVVLLQILQWILRIILFLLLLIVVLAAIVLIVPIRYQVEGELLEKKPGGRGKITWFFYLIYMKFCYEEEFHIQVKVFGFKVFDSAKESSDEKKTKKKPVEVTESIAKESSDNGENNISQDHEKLILDSSPDELAAWEKEMEAEEKEEAEFAVKMETEFSKQRLQEKVNISSKAEEKISSGIEQSSEVSQEEQDNNSEKEQKSLSEKIEGFKSKIQNIIQKIKEIIAKIQEGKLKVEHYLDLWKRKETQITFSRAKMKFGRMIKAVLPRQWKLTGEVGFSDPCTTGQMMGALGAMYPILGNKVQILPNFENEVIKIEGSVKGHIRLGNLLYQLVSLILNRHCFKFIKLVLGELGGAKKVDKNG